MNCESLRKHAKNIIDFEKKVLPLTKEELKSHQDVKVCYICGKRILKKFANDENYQKVRDHCHYTDKYKNAAHSICNLKFNIPSEVSVVFHNGMIIISLWENKQTSSRKNLNVLGENTGKHNTLSLLQ